MLVIEFAGVCTLVVVDMQEAMSPFVRLRFQGMTKQGLLLHVPSSRRGSHQLDKAEGLPFCEELYFSMGSSVA